MARGIPVALSDAGALPEVAGEAALVFRANDVSALEAALRRLLADPALRAELVESGRRRYLKHFQPAAMGRRLLATFRGTT